MDHIGNFLYQSFGILLFSMGVTLLLMNDKEFYRIYDKAILEYQNSPIVSQGMMEEGEEVRYYSKGYIIALLLEPLEYDIQINQYIINKHFHDTSKIHNYIIVDDWFKKTYQYDNEGNIERIIFVGRERE